MSSDRTTVVVADDHPLYRAGLVDAIAERPDLELVAECAGGRDAVEQILALRPDVALLDMRMRDLDGMAVLKELARAGASARVVFLSAYEEGEVVHGALTAGPSATCPRRPTARRSATPSPPRSTASSWSRRTCPRCWSSTCTSARPPASRSWASA